MISHDRSTVSVPDSVVWQQQYMHSRGCCGATPSYRSKRLAGSKIVSLRETESACVRSPILHKNSTKRTLGLLQNLDHLLVLSPAFHLVA